MKNLLCPLKFNIALLGMSNEWREGLEKEGISVKRDLMECEKENCALYIKKEKKEWEAGGVTTTEKEQIGCSIKILAEK